MGGGGGGGRFFAGTKGAETIGNINAHAFALGGNSSMEMMAGHARMVIPDAGTSESTRKWDVLSNWDGIALAGAGIVAIKLLPRLKGKSPEQLNKILEKNGFKFDKSTSKGLNLRYQHRDGSTVMIHPYSTSGAQKSRAASNAHVHKESPQGHKIADRGIEADAKQVDKITSKIKNNPSISATIKEKMINKIQKIYEKHIGIKNPANFPSVRGRPHGSSLKNMGVQSTKISSLSMSGMKGIGGKAGGAPIKMTPHIKITPKVGGGGIGAMGGFTPIIDHTDAPIGGRKKK